MGEQLQKALKSIRQYWNAQERRKKIIYISILAAVILIVIIVTIILNKKDYVMLYEGLETEEASEIAAEIQNLGYEVNLNSGGSVSVLKGTENQLAMDMAMLGYPRGSGSLNYPAYTERVGMLTTESEKKTYLEIDLENRLSAIVASLEDVERAVVTLAIPEQRSTVITTLRQEPSASVVVYLENGVTLSNEQITGITHLVSSSVEGLKDENVSINDGYGIPQIIGENPIDVVADMTRKFAFETQLENSTKNKVLELLIPGYSEENISVAVDYRLNFDSRATEITDYSPEPNTNTGVTQQEQGSEATGYEVVEGGIVGVEGNADDTYPTGELGEGTPWVDNSFSRTYLVDTAIEQIAKDNYSIDGLSIAVMLYTGSIDDETRGELIKLIANAGGINPEFAADLVSVVNIDRDNILPEDAVPVEAKFLFGLTLNQLLIVGAALVVFLIILFIALVITGRAARKKRERFEQQIIESTQFDELHKAVFDEGFSVNSDGQSVEVPSLTDDSIETKEVVIRREISEFAKSSPDIVAQLLKNWMKEEEE